MMRDHAGGGPAGGRHQRVYDLHGRRLGRPLRRGRAHALQHKLPSIAIDPAGLPAGTDPADLFDIPVREVWCEIGFGAGEHLIAQARANPDIGIIGAEPFLNGVSRLVNELPDDTRNVRVLADDVRPLLDRLAEASLSRAFILFPDPWSKARHHKRRIVSAPMLDILARLMKPGAELRIATDVPSYLLWMLRHILVHPAFVWTARRAEDWRCRPEDWPETRYEQKAIEAGRVPVYLSLRRREGGVP